MGLLQVFMAFISWATYVLQWNIQKVATANLKIFLSSDH